MYTLTEWRKEMKGLQKPPNVVESIRNVLNGKWLQYSCRLGDKVILLLTHVLFAYSIHSVHEHV